MNIKRMLAVLLTVAVVLVSLPLSASAYTAAGAPECYLTAFSSSQWSANTGTAVTFNDDDGTISQPSNEIAHVKYSGSPYEALLSSFLL